MSPKGTNYTKYLLIAHFELHYFLLTLWILDGFDNQGIVSGIFMRQRWVLLLVDEVIYFTETFYKMHCITMGYTTPAKKYWNYTKTNAWEDHEVWTLLGKATKFSD